jgi:hypothetical protein
MCRCADGLMGWVDGLMWVENGLGSDTIDTKVMYDPGGKRQTEQRDEG